jgi:hypothetical protein
MHLWLEDIQEQPAGVWSLERFALAGRHLGRFNGQYLARRVPNYPWLNRDFLRARADLNVPFWARLEELRRHPMFGVVFPGDAGERTLALFRERYMFLDALDRLPQTLVHHDADRRNLLASDKPGVPEQTIAIDWAYTGIGPIGADAAALVVSSVLWGRGVAPSDLPELDSRVFEGYLLGLSDAGWHGDPSLARLGYAATAAIRYGAAAGVLRNLDADEARREALARAVGRPFEDVMAQFELMLPYVLACAHEARHMITAPSRSITERRC